MNSVQINKKKLYFFDILTIIIIIAGDRVSKFFVLKNLLDRPSYSLIPGICELRYHQNYGLAFGLFSGQKIFLLSIATFVVIVCCYLILKMPSKKAYSKASILLSMIIAGTIGNMTDRIMYDYVIDFIYLKFKIFPIFNISDIFITLAVLIMLFLLIFHYHERDLNFLNIVEQRTRDIR